MKRRVARENVFFLAFESILNKSPIDELIELAYIGRECSLDEYANSLIHLIVQNETELDEKIAKHLNKWRIGRLPKTTLAILRLAICEIDHIEGIPVSVTINEAVEIAKKFATDEDAAYINGVLGSYVRQAALSKADNRPGKEQAEEDVSQ